MHRLRALVVGDNEQAREIIAETVSSLGLQTYTVNSGKKAVKLMLDHKQSDVHNYDVIFMDYRMPDIDGVTAAKLIKAERELGCSPTVVMISAYDLGVIRDDMRAAVDAFIQKPVSRSRVFDTLAELFGKGAVDNGESKDLGINDFSQLEGTRVLLVEDNIVNQKVAVGILHNKHVDVEVARNGLHCLEVLAEKNRDDLILMDMEMSEMDGFTATRRIRGLDMWRDIPIIAMTAHAIKGDRERCLNVGMDGYISKPISPQLLYKTIDDVRGGG